MFSTKEQLIKKTGKHGVGRFAFLQQLVNEYNASKSQEAKEQVLANLANFAYDPVNYDYLWKLRILDLFFGALEDNNNKIVSYAIGGICNICLEPLSREYIIRSHGIKSISTLLSSNEESIILSVITTLIYLDTPSSRKDITAPANVKRITELSKSTNPRIKNVACIFLKDVCNINISNEFHLRKFTTAKRRLANSTNCDTNKSTVKANTVTSTTATASTSSTPY